MSGLRTPELRLKYEQLNDRTGTKKNDKIRLILIQGDVFISPLQFYFYKSLKYKIFITHCLISPT